MAEGLQKDRGCKSNKKGRDAGRIMKWRNAGRKSREEQMLERKGK